MPDLHCVGVAKAYGARRVLTDVDLEVPSGTLTAILGASGSGKTTLLRVVVGFVAPDHGTIAVGDDVLADERRHVAPERRAIGYVPQEGALFPHLTVGENIGFGLARAERQHGARVAETLELVGLDESYAPRRPHELSGGEQRRVALARALAPRPRLVLLDEPFSGLDAQLRGETREAVRGALAELETTAVLVTHDQAEALSLGREVAVLRDGRLVQRSDPATLYRTPVDLDVARFVGDAVVVTGRADGAAVVCALGNLVLAEPGARGAVDVMIRPEQIRMARDGDGARATVAAHTYLGPDTVVRLTLADAPHAAVTARTFDHAVPAVGERVVLTVTGPVVAYPASGARPGDDDQPDPAASLSFDTA